MNTILSILALLVIIPAVLFLVRVLLFWPNVVAQVSADGTNGLLYQIKAALHYLYNVEKLNTVYIRDGKFTHRPVRLVRNSEDKPSDNDKRS